MPGVILNIKDIAVNKKNKNPHSHTTWNLDSGEKLKGEKSYPFSQNRVCSFNL